MPPQRNNVTRSNFRKFCSPAAPTSQVNRFLHPPIFSACLFSLLALVTAAPLATAAPLPPPRPTRLISNVISPAHCPDPDVFFHEGYYYAARSKIEASADNLDPPGFKCWHGAQNQVLILKARRLEDVYINPEATAVVINRSSIMDDGSTAGSSWGGISVGAFEVSYHEGDGCPSPGFWAPALKIINGNWFLFITGHRPDLSGEANFVLENINGGDVMNVSNWVYRGMLGHKLPGLDGEPIVLPTNDPFTAAVTLTDNGKTVTGSLYFMYSHNVPASNGDQQLNLVRLRVDDSQFTEYDSDRGQNMTYTRRWAAEGEAPISVPMFDWERQACSGCNFGVNEGPTALYGPTTNSTFILYSASFCATKYYSIGMLEFSGVGGGFPFLWTKFSLPVFSGDVFNDETGEISGVQSEAYGIGHNSITTSPDLSESWIVYHAKSTQNEGPGDREARAQLFTWSATGRPNFSQGPLPRGTLMAAPSEAAPSRYSGVASSTEEAAVEKSSLKLTREEEHDVVAVRGEGGVFARVVRMWNLMAV